MLLGRRLVEREEEQTTTQFSSALFVPNLFEIGRSGQEPCCSHYALVRGQILLLGPVLLIRTLSHPITFPSCLTQIRLQLSVCSPIHICCFCCPPAHTATYNGKRTVIFN